MGVRPASIVMGSPLVDDYHPMTFVEGDQEVETIAANATVQALANTVRLRRSHGCSQDTDPGQSVPCPRSGRGAQFHPAVPGAGVQPNAPAFRVRLPALDRVRAAAVAATRGTSVRSRLRFSRHGGIYWSDVALKNYLPMDRCGASRWSTLSITVGARLFPPRPLIVRDQFPPAIPRSGCSSAEPVSAVPS
jgi:hypothetical protein